MFVGLTRDSAGQRLIKISDNIGDRFESDGYPQRPVSDPGDGPSSLAEAAVGGGRWMGYQ